MQADANFEAHHSREANNELNPIINKTITAGTSAVQDELAQITSLKSKKGDFESSVKEASHIERLTKVNISVMFYSHEPQQTPTLSKYVNQSVNNTHRFPTSVPPLKNCRSFMVMVLFVRGGIGLTPSRDI
ncbi:hypothetical protein DICVIV_04601 [Dictyocaulus viviparus]|uniref:Uncharacterized protein n=1 Tax=Dictyocaulus viviparus TaxID=29172 RepID=A0A0D8XZU6_DICVI|nr:hypothetical protein DICVIV_04601 [Dictyocaulus viviparus]